MSKQIFIAKQAFAVTEPYSTGHVLTEMEARVLNQVRAENIGNNFRKAVADTLAGKEGAKTMEELQKEFAEYDAAYNFTAVRRSAGPRLSPLDAECVRLAKAWLVSKLKEAGKTFKTYLEENGKEAVDTKVGEIAKVEAIVALAKKNLANQSKAPELGIDL